LKSHIGSSCYSNHCLIQKWRPSNWEFGRWRKDSIGDDCFEDAYFGSLRCVVDMSIFKSYTKACCIKVSWTTIILRTWLEAVTCTVAATYTGTPNTPYPTLKPS
jgi:hypothetical protein